MSLHHIGWMKDIIRTGYVGGFQTSIQSTIFLVWSLIYGLSLQQYTMIVPSVILAIFYYIVISAFDHNFSIAARTSHSSCVWFNFIIQQLQHGFFTRILRHLCCYLSFFILLLKTAYQRRADPLLYS